MSDGPDDSRAAPDLCMEYRMGALAKKRAASLYALGDVEQARKELARARDLGEASLGRIRAAAELSDEKLAELERLDREADQAVEALLLAVDREDDLDAREGASAADFELALEDLDRRLSLASRAGRALQRLRTSWMRLQYSVHRTTLAGVAASDQSIEALRRDVTAGLEALRVAGAPAALTHALAEALERHDEILTARVAARADRDASVRMVDAAVLGLDRLIAPLGVRTDRTTAPRRAGRLGAVRRASTLLGFVAAASLVGAAVITVMTASGILGPLRRPAESNGRIAAGGRAEPPAIEGLGEHGDPAGRSEGTMCHLAPSCEPLLASEARYRTLFEYARDGVVVLNETGLLIQANAAAESLLGCSAQGLQGMAFRDLLPASEHDSFKRRLHKLIESGQPHGEIELVRSDGSRVAAEAAGAWLPGGHVVLTLRDVSQRREMERALVQGEKLSAVGRLAAAVAHELRNPLFVISNVLHDLRERIDSGLPEIVDDLQMAAEESRRARLIIDNLLEFSRPVHPADCRLDPAPAIQQVLRLFRESLGQRRIKLEVNLLESRPCCFNPDAFKQVMVNLLSNAMDAMPSGGRLRIRTAPSPDGGVEVSVVDTGRGMSPEERKQIFTPFYSTKKVGLGTGLGLWIVHLTVERYRGRVSVDSAEGCGTAFRLDLSPLEETA